MKNRVILVTGGARSGKSTFAVRLAEGLGDKVLYVATARASDAEMKIRISNHAKSRPVHWKTLETSYDLDLGTEERFDVVLVDCLTLLVNNLLLRHIAEGSLTIGSGQAGFEGQAAESPGTNSLTWEESESNETWEDLEKVNRVERRVLDIVSAGIEGIKKRAEAAILVTNEVGMGVVPSFPLGRLYRDLMGAVNQLVSEEADEVYLLLSGIQLKIKGGLES
jgi:adenosylcobinamide kinase/adenosylcobinamide-phosphate guanylyltransferase